VALVALLLAAVVGASAADASTPALSSFGAGTSGRVIHSAVSRVIDLRTHVEEVSLLISAKNNGDAALKHYLLAVPGDKAPRLAYIEASQGRSKIVAEQLASVSGLPSPVAGADSSALSNATLFSLALPTPLAAGGQTDLKVVLVFTRTLRPYPESIEQADQQLVLWDDSAFFFSPYITASQETQIKLASSKVESFTKIKSGATHGGQAKRSGDDLRYGPFTDVPAFTRSSVQVHSVNNSPFVTFTSLSKDIEVSHWGNVAVQDNVLLSHTGAKLRGEFTRFDYERTRNGEQAPASFRTLVAELPRTATDIYYRDCIGNVSTSHVRKPVPGRDSVTRVEVDPRFPMFGGWNADFMLGYNLPSQHYLSVDNTDSSRFVLNMSFAAPFASAAIDDLVVRVILPEGATDIQWSTPFDISSASFTEFKTYLDTTGRPTLILRKSNAVKQHNQHFVVVYRFGTAAILREPLLVTGAVFACLLFAIAMYHTDLRISDDGAAAENARAVQPSAVKTRRTGTALGAQVQEVLENLLARPNGLLALAEERPTGSTASAARASLLATLSKELTQALRRLEGEDAATFAPIVAPLVNSIAMLQKAATKYAAASAGAEAKAAREGLAAIVEQIHEQAQKMAQL